jgi:hypothetical protein
MSTTFEAKNRFIPGRWNRKNVTSVAPTSARRHRIRPTIENAYHERGDRLIDPFAVKAWMRAGAVLWLLTAWPVWTVDLPPYQDLPSHLAAAWVQLHPDRFPELVSNGFWKTNSAFFLFLHVVGNPFGMRVAAKLFITLTLGAGAFAYPFAVERLGSPKAVRSAALLAWPFVHSWFVAMGMLDFALGVPLGLLTLVALAAHDRAPSIGRALTVAVLGVLVWYTHAFVFLIVCMLVAIEALSRGRALELAPKLRTTLRLTLPLLPAIVLTLISVVEQLSTETARPSQTQFRGVGAILYGMWAEWMWSMTKWTLVTIVPTLVLGWFGLRRAFRVTAPFFSPAALVVLGVACLCAPHFALRWAYLGSRFIPFFWIALLLRVPDEMPRWLSRTLAACALAYSIGLGIEIRSIEHDWRRVVAAEPAVPERSHLLTLAFEAKGRHGDNTYPFVHVSSLFVLDRDAMIPSLFAHSKSFPITYVESPPRQFEQLTLEGVSEKLATRKAFCESRDPIYPSECAPTYAAAWSEFWREAAARFDHALLIDASHDVRKNIPASFVTVWDKDDVVVVKTNTQ